MLQRRPATVFVRKRCVKRKTIRSALLFIIILIVLVLLLSGAAVITIRILVLP